MKKSVFLRILSIVCAVCVLGGSFATTVFSGAALSGDVGYTDIETIERDFKAAYHDSISTINTSTVLLTDSDLSSMENKKKYDEGGYTSLADYLFSVNKNGELIRDTDYGTYSNRKTGLLYFDERLTDFEMSFDFHFSTESSSYNGVYIGFGAETIGEIWANDADKKGNTAIFLQGADHNLLGNGSTTVKSDYTKAKVNYSAVEAKYSADKGAWFSFKLSVEGGKAVWSIDGEKVAEYTPEDYVGGYVYFGTMAKEAAFRNITVKAKGTGYSDMEDIENDFLAAAYDKNDKNLDKSTTALITDQTVEELEHYKKYQNGGYTSLADYLFSIDDAGNLVRDNDYGTSGDKKIGFLYYDTKLKNFTVELEYRHSTATSGTGWKTIYFGFGAQNIGSHAYNDAQSGAIRVQPKEMYSYFGKTLTGRFNDNADYKPTVEKYEQDAANGSENWNTYKMTVQDGKVTWYVNGKAFSKELSGYLGGYFYISAMTLNTAFKNIRITPLPDDEEDIKPSAGYKTYYASSGSKLDASNGKETVFENCWSLDDGIFTRTGSGEFAGGPNGRNGESLIYLTDKSYEAFTLELDYSVGANKNTWKWMAVGFGADSIGSHYAKGDGYLAFVEQEGYVSYHYPNGNSTKSERIHSQKNQAYYDDITSAGESDWHHLKITVRSDVMSISYDNGATYTKDVPNSAGYVYISCFVPEMRFKNISITELDNEDDKWSEGYSAYYIGKDVDFRNAGTSFKETAPKSVFTYSDETLTRSGSGDLAPSTSGVKGQAMLAFKESYKNFVLEYDYSFAGATSTWKWAAAGFGAEKSGDHFAGAGGYLAFIEQEGYRSYFSGAKSNRIGGAISDYEALVKSPEGDTSWHHFRLVVTGSVMELYLDNYDVASVGLENYSGGYVSIFSNTPGMKIKNIEISEIDYIASVGEIEDITAELGAAETSLKLPSNVSVTLGSGGSKTLPVKRWKCGGYDPNTAGIYVFEGELDLKDSGIYENDKNRTVKAVVNLADYDTSAVTKYTFTNEERLNDIFYSYYFGIDGQIGKNNAVLKPTAATNTWDVTANGGIKRTGVGDYDGTSSGNKGHAALYFKEKYDEFELDFDYCFNGTTGGWKWVSVGVGVNTPGLTSYEKDGTLFSLEQEGQIRMIGGDPAPLITPKSAFKGYTESVSDKALSISTWHHMKVAVKNGTLYIYVDDYPVASTKMEDYKAGHVFIMAATKNLEFKNITIGRIKTAQIVSDIPYRAVKLGTSVDAIDLPTALDIKVGGKTVSCPVEWSSADYNGGTEGTYVFYATPCGKYSHYWLSKTAKRAIACVSVGNLDDEVTHKFALNSAEELEAYFTGYYSANDKALNEAGEWRPTAVGNTWALSSEGITRAGTGKYSGGSKGTYGAAALYYNEKLENFEIEFDYRHGKSGWRWFQFGFGAKEIGQNYYNSGYLAYVEREGDVTVNGTVKEKLDYANPFPSDRFMDGYLDKVLGIWDGSGKWCHMRLAVIDKTLYIYIDDNAVWKCELDSSYSGGYIYLLANSSETQIANLSITNFDAKNVVIASVQSAKSLGCEVQTIDKTKGDQLSFPSSAVVTDINGYNYNIPIEWKAPSNYRSGKLGSFSFSGVPVMPSSKFTNPNKVSTSATVINSKVDYDTKNTVKYYFDHENDLLDFTNYYSSNAATTDLAPNNWREQWTVEGGVLQRINDDFGKTPADTFRQYYKLARLTYNDALEGNYRIELEYKQDSETWMWPMLCFSIADKTKYMITYNERNKSLVQQPVGGTAVYLEREGAVNYWGNMVSANLSDIRIRMLRTIDKFEGYDHKKPHKMTFTFIDGVARLAVDSYETTVAARIPDDSIGEYIALMTNSNAAYFDNFSITKLPDDAVDYVVEEIENVEIKEPAKIVQKPVTNDKTDVLSIVIPIAVIAAAAIIFFVSLFVLYKYKSKKTERK